MERVNLYNAKVSKNSMELSLKDFNLCFNIESNLIIVELIDNNLSKIALRFNNLEDAFIFMRKTINKCHTINEVIEIYDILNNEDVNRNRIVLTPDEVTSAIVDYYGANKDYKVSVDEDNKYDGLELKVKEKGHSLTKKKSDN